MVGAPLLAGGVLCLIVGLAVIVDGVRMYRSPAEAITTNWGYLKDVDFHSDHETEADARRTATVELGIGSLLALVGLVIVVFAG